MNFIHHFVDYRRSMPLATGAMHPGTQFSRGGMVLATLMLAVMTGCSNVQLIRTTGNPDLAEPRGHYIYKQGKADEEENMLEKSLAEERRRTEQLNGTAEQLKRQIAALRSDRNRQSKILESSSSSVQEKNRARDEKEKLQRKIEVLEKELDFMVRAS